MSIHEIILSKSRLPVYFELCETNSHIVPSHWHTHVEVLYILSGTMQVICHEESYTLQAHDFFIVNSGDIHYTRSIGLTNLILLQIPCEFLNQIITDFHTVHFIEHFSNYSMEHSIYEMEQIYKKGEEGYEFLFNSHLNLFLHTLYTKYSIRNHSKEDKSLERLKKIITYVEQHYMDPLSLQEVAKLFALNPEYFCRYFKKYMNFTFLEYVNMVRIHHIYQDLLQTNDSITKLLERHGFYNYKLFRRMFYTTYGCTPTDIRKNVSTQLHKRSEQL